MRSAFHTPGLRLSALSLALAAVLPFLTLQVAYAAEETPLEDVIVTGSKPLPAASGLFRSERLMSKRASLSDTARLLQDQPGVSFYGAGGVSSLPVIRGLADDRLRVKVDGMDLLSACANHMNPPMSYIDPSAVGRIDVFAGVSPVSAGGDSLGGTILVSSPDPVFAQPGQGLMTLGELGAHYRSNGDAMGSHLAATLATERLSLTYRASAAKAANYKAASGFKAAGPAAGGRGWLESDDVGSTSYKSINQSLALGLRHEQHLVELKLGLQEIPYQNWPNQRMDMTANDSRQVNLRYKGYYDWGLLEARIYREHTKHQMQFGPDKLYWYAPTVNLDGTPGTIAGGATGYAAGMPMETEGKNIGITTRAEWTLSLRDRIRVGGEMQQYRLDDWWDPSGKGMWPNAFWNVRDGERDRLALFGEWEAKWTPVWTSQFGLRHETVDMNAGAVQGYNATFSPYDQNAFNAAQRRKTDHNLDLVALARFKPSAEQTYEFGYSMKTRSPNLYERYAWSTNGMAMRMVNMVGDGNGYVGNLDLNPETAHTLSATADWHDASGERWGVKVSPYLTYVDDYIDAERCAVGSTDSGTACTATNQTLRNGFVYLRYVNQSARLYGLDVSGQALLSASPAAGTLTAKGHVSYVRGANRTTGDNLYNMMPLNARLALEQRLGAWTGTVETELVSAKNDVSSVRNEVGTAGYGLLHLRGSYEVQAVRFDFGVENVLDHFYNHPLGGAYTGQGKTMSATGVAWGLPVPGPGRGVYLGMSAKF